MICCKMFRGSHCPIRPLLLFRETHLSAFPDCTSSRCQRRIKNWKYEEISGKSKTRSSLSTKLVSCDSNKVLYENLLPKAVYHNRLQVSAKTKQTSYLTNVFWNSFISQTFIQLWKRPRDLGWISFTNYQCNFLQSRPHHRHCSFHPVSFLAHTPRIHFQQPPRHPFNPIRTVHQAACHVTNVWRDCLSLENENRCRQNLVPNWKFYDMDKVRKGASQTQGKNRERWASILVSLCSVEGDPAFLFTLRSSSLKGRHKGDVSFAGGKSDPSDRDVVATALREAREELGIHVLTEKVWGVMKPLRDASGMMIAPVLANLGPLEELTFKPNPQEVEEIFTLSLFHLCNPLNRSYTNFRTGDKFGYTLPVFCNGKHRVWGLTAVALDQTLKLVVPPK